MDQKKHLETMINNLKEIEKIARNLMKEKEEETYNPGNIFRVYDSFDYYSVAMLCRVGHNKFTLIDIKDGNRLKDLVYLVQNSKNGLNLDQVQQLSKFKVEKIADSVEEFFE